MTFRILTLDEIVAEADKMEREALARRAWGKWRLDTTRLQLILEDRPGLPRYFVDLCRMGRSAAVLDWIFQVQGKSWCRAKDVADLVSAVRDIFDPQATLCSFSASGRDGKEIDAHAFLRKRYPA